MNEQHLLRIATELNVGLPQVRATATLFADGATVPFIARYRKEATGGLDEVQITTIRDRTEQLFELDRRREAIVKSLEERNLLTDTLKGQIAGAETLTRLEDIYLPYKPKRRTRAMIARERGLEPLAEFIRDQQGASWAEEAPKYVDAEKEVPDVEAALAGARDIIAEWVSDSPEARAEIREIYEKEGILMSEVIPGKETEGAKFKDYFNWSEPLRTAPSHRVLAIRRGAQENFLFFSIQPPQEKVESLLLRRFVDGRGENAEQVQKAVLDAYKRLMGPSLETEVRLSSKKLADAAAIEVFAGNLRELLLASPLGQRSILAIDPGFRTGCKVVCLDAQGNLIYDDVIYLSQSKYREDEARDKVLAALVRYKIEAIAIGNGTASRETEAFIRSIGVPASIPVVVVNESGASIYSASEVAREEFPEKDVTVRGTVSIGRRLMDPLAELVKLDPKSIGVGQYQHDVDQRLLKQSLDDVVISCVNGVGVEVNTSSKQLLSYVSGLNGRIAENIVTHRAANGPFASRKELLKVAGLGPKAYEQCAGFLRIRNGKHPLDASAVHPESYPVVEQMAADLGCSIEDLIGRKDLSKQIDLQRYVTDTVGLPTLLDIVEELAKPGRDPRKQFEVFKFSEEAHEITDLRVGMKLPGIVTNVAAFGAFVDIGVHQDGLVHISQLSDNFVDDPAKVVKVQQHVTVTVTEVDIDRKRIGLSMKSQPEIGGRRECETSERPGEARGNGPRRPDNRDNRGNFRGGNQNRGNSAAPRRDGNQSLNNGLFDGLDGLKF
ncbi:MAG: RNA-binding transcriptional accessory protein [Opitutales bacterium]|nr:RNA-binding transcriptional accessory protein [Opitutales bacterium]